MPTAPLDSDGLRRARTLVGRLARFDVLALTALVWFFAKFLRYAFPPLFSTFQGEYGVSTALMGTAFTGMMVAYAAMQFPSGVLADRVGAVRVIVAGAVVTAAGALSLLLAGPFAALVAGMALLGLGTGVHKTVAVRLTARVYTRRTGRALGVLDTLGALGGVAAPVAVVALLPDWRLLFGLGGVTVLALTVAFAMRVPDRTSPPESTPGTATGDLRTYLGLFCDPRLAAFTLALVAFTFTSGGVLAFLPLFLTDAAGLSQATAGGLYSALFLASLGQLATGDLGDRVGHLAVIAGLLAVAGAGLVVVLLPPPVPLPLVAAGVVAFGFGVHGLIPVRGAYLMAVLPDEAAGGALGVVRTLFMGSNAAGPAAVGALAGIVGLRAAFWVLAGALGLALVFVVVAALLGR
jgi:MFS family permease